MPSSLNFIEGHSNDVKDLEPLRTWSTRIAGEKAPATAATQPDSGERREPDPERFRDFQSEFEPPGLGAGHQGSRSPAPADRGSGD